MAVFKITSELPLGLSHFGEVLLPAESTVELTDEEVQSLVRLIEEKKTIDLKKLELIQTHPIIYEKLKNAYRQMTQDAEEIYWLWEGFRNGYIDYDEQELMKYCYASCGFKFDFDKNDYLDEDGEVDDESVEEAEREAFDAWLYDYLYNLEDAEFKDFMHNHMNTVLDVNYVQYRVKIPEAIINMARRNN